MAYSGFPRDVRSTPVPNPLFGELLEQIDDIAELRCTLRLVWLLNRKKGSPRWVSHGELMADRPLLKASSAGGDAEAEVLRGLRLAVRRGTVLASEGTPGSERYTLNTETGRSALEAEADDRPAADNGTTPWEGVAERPNIYGLYEDNIGMLSPMIAEELKEAEEQYPRQWIEDAVREAVRANRRSWRYVSAILERWEREGRQDGEPGRHSQTTGYQEYFRRRSGRR